jgi:hypothetical protein
MNVISLGSLKERYYVASLDWYETGAEECEWVHGIMFIRI